jgi:cell division protein FtsA
MSNSFVALDVGASKVVCLRGSKSGNKIVIDSLVRHISEGIKRGDVTNEKIFVEDIASTIYESEKIFSANVSEVFVNISNSSVKYKHINVFKKFEGRQVTEKDLERILEKVRRKFEESGHRVIKINFLQHHVEGLGTVDEPEYMFVNGLTSTISVIYIQENYIKNLENLIAKSHAKVKKFILSAEASATCCITKEEVLQNTIFLDIGAGNADYIVYKNDKAMEYGVVPLGGSDITRDIAIYFNLNFEVAEEIKKLHGGLIIDKNEQYIRTQDKSGGNKIIDKKLLKEIISARLEEIFSLVIKNTKSRGQKFSFMLTGGSSNISGIEVFLNKKYGILARVITPSETGIFVQKKEKSNLLSDPSLSTACGLLKIAAQHEKKAMVIPQKNTFLKLLKWIQENF